jgi:type IV secretion system protein VirB9
MKPLIPIFISAGLALASLPCRAATDPHPLQPNAPRTVVVSEVDTPPVIRSGLLQSTLIVLPAEEKVANVFAGDTVDWVFDGGHVASRFISVKPKVANGSTDIHIVSDHGNEYTLQLREVSIDADPHFDSKVFINPGDKAAKERLAQLPVFVPAAEFDKAKQEAASAKAAQAAELKADETKAKQYRSQYPGSLHFDLGTDAACGRHGIPRPDGLQHSRECRQLAVLRTSGCPPFRPRRAREPDLAHPGQRHPNVTLRQGKDILEGYEVAPLLRGPPGLQGPCRPVEPRPDRCGGILLVRALFY